MGADEGNEKCPLLRLPAELREQIYRFCFASSAHEAQTEISDRPREPPLTYVSQRLRSETLPIYYASYTLPVRTYIKCDSNGIVWLKTNKWYHNLHTSKLKQILNFQIRFIRIERYSGEQVPLDFDIALDKRACSYSIRQYFSREWLRSPHRTGDPADFEEVMLVLKAHLNTALDALMKDNGIEGLSADDVDDLVKVDPDTLP